MVPWESKAAPREHRLRTMPASVPAMLESMEKMVYPKAS